MIYSSWDIEQNILKLVILGYLLPFYPHKTPKIKILENKKFAGDIMILHICTKSHNHMMYSSWDTEWDRHNFLSIWAIFCPFSPLKTWKIKMNNTPDIIILQMCTINDCLFMVPEIWSGPSFTLLPPYQPEKSKFWKIKKNPGDIIIFHMRTINDNHMMYSSEIWSVTDRIFCHFRPFFTFSPL